LLENFKSISDIYEHPDEVSKRFEKKEEPVETTAINPKENDE
jgi:hypothetical protein